MFISAGSNGSRMFLGQTTTDQFWQLLEWVIWDMLQWALLLIVVAIFIWFLSRALQ